MTALLLEDDPNLCEVLARNLREIFDEVRVFGFLQDLQDYRSTLPECPALVWMDLRLPGSDVTDVFDEMVRIRESCPNSIMVVMTGMPEPEIRSKARKAGADEVVPKPIRMSVLDMLRLIFVGAVNAMSRGSSNSPRVLTNVCNMVIKCMHSHLAHHA